MKIYAANKSSKFNSIPFNLGEGKINHKRRLSEQCIRQPPNLYDALTNHNHEYNKINRYKNSRRKSCLCDICGNLTEKIN